MTASSQRALEDQAAEWAVRLAAAPDARVRADFERWLAADPANYAAFAEADLALGVLAPRGISADRAALRRELQAAEHRRRTRRGRWITFSAVGLAAAAILLLTLAPLSGPPRPATVPLAAAVVGPRVENLPGGSVIELNSGADVAVEFTPDVRGVRLVRGEAHFVVAQDPGRPFVVSVDRVEIRALGTAFKVHYTPEAVEVLITEGRVRVSIDRASGPGAGELPSRDVDLTAGHRAVISLTDRSVRAPAVEAVPPEEIQRDLAWRQVRVEFSNARLEEAVALFNQRGETQFAIGDAGLRDLRISGICRGNNPRQFAELIESSLDVRAMPDAGNRIVFRRR